MKWKISFEFTDDINGVIIGGIVVILIILAILVCIPAVTKTFKASFEATLSDGRIIKGSISLEDGQAADEEDGEKTGVSNKEFSVEIRARVVGNEDKAFRYIVNTNIGDTVEFQIQYKNIGKKSHKHVVVSDVLPENLQYIGGSTKLYNADYPKGAVAKQDTIVTEGVNIGNYAAGANAFVRFRAEVVSDAMAEDVNELINWGKVQAGADKKAIMHDDAIIVVQKAGIG